MTRDGRLRLWTTLRRVTPSEAYTYWTEEAKLAAWWPEGTTLTPSETDRGRRLVFELTEGKDSLLAGGRAVVDFERRDDDTLLTVTQGPLGETAEEALLETWTQRLGRLKGALEHPI